MENAMGLARKTLVNLSSENAARLLGFIEGLLHALEIGHAIL
jgi:hypothetical protein